MYPGPAAGAEDSPTFGSGPHAGDGFPMPSPDFGFIPFLKPYALGPGVGGISLKWRSWFWQFGVGFPSSRRPCKPSMGLVRRGFLISGHGLISGVTPRPLPGWSLQGSSFPQDCGRGVELEGAAGKPALMGASRVRSTHPPSPRMAGRVDRKHSGLNFTLFEFQKVRHTELFQRQKVPPRGLSEWVARTREADFCN